MASHHEPAVPTLGIEALRTLGTAWGNLGAYPSGHPALARALERAHAALGLWLDSRGDLVLGVRSQSFLVGDATLESPQATRLARALYERGVAVLRIDTGVQLEELTALLRVLTGQPDRPGRLPAWDELAAAGVERIQLQPVDYSLVRVTSELGPDEPAPRDPSPGDAGPGESESLTERIVRILMERAPRDGAGQPLWDQLLTVRERLRTDQLEPRPGSGDGGGPGEGADPGSGAGAAFGSVDPATAALANLIAAYASEAVGVARGAEAADRTRVPVGPGSGGGSGASATSETPGERPSVAGGLRGGPAGVEASGAGRLSSRVDVLGVALGAVETHLTRPGQGARLLAARQTAELALALPPAIREIVMKAALRVLGVHDDGSALHAFSSPFAPDSIVRVLGLLAAEGVTLSRHALLLIQTMAAIRATAGQPQEDEEDEALADALRNELIALFRDDDVDRFNPEDHQALLARVALEVPTAPRASAETLATLGDRVDSLGDDILAEQLGHAFLQLLAKPPAATGGASITARLEGLFRLFLARGRLEQAVHVAQALKALADDVEQPDEMRALAAAGLVRLSGVDALAGLAMLAPSDHSGAARRLIALLGPSAVDSLLLVLIGEQNRSYRRHVFDMLVSLGAVIVPGARRWLGDERWYVVRNMTGLLRSVGDRSSLPDVYLLVGHPDPRVRLDALRSLLALRAPEGVDALVRMIDDPDESAASAAIVLAGESRPPEVVEALLRVLDGWDLLHRRRSARRNALRALARIGDPAALPRLGRFFDSWLTALLAREERHEAYRSLAGYPEPARRAIVERGLTSRDDEIRRICRELAAADSRGSA